MDSLLGSWKLQFDRQEGPLVESIKAMEIPDEFVEMFAKAVYTLTIEKEGDKFKYSFTMEGMPQVHVCGPFTLGQQFEFFDSFCKRTELITMTCDGGRTKEVTTIKEKPDVSWTVERYLKDGEMITETETKGLKCKSYLKKV